MIRINKISEFFIFSNLYVALPVSALAACTFLMYDLQIEWIPILFIYLSTLSLYNLHRLVGLKKVEKQFLNERHTWALEHENVLKIILVLALSGNAFLALTQFDLETFKLLIIPGLIGGGYTLPLIKRKGKIYRLRDVPFIKIFLISVTVSYITVFFPMSFSQGIVFYDQEAQFMTFLARFFFIFAITIPFDIRDLKFDSTGNIQTIPMIFGINIAKQIGLLCLVLFAGISLMQFQGEALVSLALIVSGIFAGWIVNFCQTDSSEYYFSFLAEGTMLAQFVLVALSTGFI